MPRCANASTACPSPSNSPRHVQRTISLGQLAARLHDRFRLLTGGARTALGRQRTLEAVVAWSYDLLDPNEQRLFRVLSVFPDSFPLDAVEAVAPTGDIDVLETLGHLVDKSLVVAVRESSYRYRMLETIRQYGRDRLLQLGDLNDAHAQLLSWVMTLTAELEQTMRSPRQDAAIRAVIPERSNARAALEWALDHDDIYDALRIASAIPLMATSQRRALLERLLGQAEELEDARCAQVLLHSRTSRWNKATGRTAPASRAAAELFAQLGDERHRAWAARYFEVFALWGDADEHDRATQLANEMVNSFRNLDDSSVWRTRCGSRHSSPPTRRKRRPPPTNQNSCSGTSMRSSASPTRWRRLSASSHSRTTARPKFGPCSSRRSRSSPTPTTSDAPLIASKPSPQ